MKNYFPNMALLLALSLAGPCFAGGGDAVNNGDGLAERNFVYAFQNLGPLIEKCLSISNPCKTTVKEDRLLHQIARSVEVTDGKGGLIFKSGALEPGFFEVDEHGKVRVAVTSSTPGTPIYVNLDLIYIGDGAEKEPLDVLSALAILVHEVGHHYGVSDHLFLDKLGAKVQSFSEQFVESIQLQKMKQKKFAVKAYNDGYDIDDYSPFSDEAQGRLVIENGYELYDLTPAVVKAISCPADSHVAGLLFTNLHWKKLEPFDQATKMQKIDVQMDLDYQCASDLPGVLGTPNFTVVLNVSADFQIQNLGVDGQYQDPHFDLEDWIYYPEAYLRMNSASLTVQASQP